MCRHTHRIPPPNSEAENEMVCLLRQQNKLLCELLGAVNSLTALGLSARGGVG